MSTGRDPHLGEVALLVRGIAAVADEAKGESKAVAELAPTQQVEAEQQADATRLAFKSSFEDQVPGDTSTFFLREQLTVHFSCQ